MWSALVRAAVAASMLWSAGWAHAAPTVSVDTVVVGSGATFTIDIRVAEAMDLTSWQFSLSFDPALLQAHGVNEGPFLASAGTTLFVPGLIDNGGGLVSLVADALIDPAAVSGDGVLARIEFTALSDGLSALTLSDVFLNFVDSDVSIVDGSVCVGGRAITDCPSQPPEVPEPGTLALAALALGAAGARARRRLPA